MFDVFEADWTLNLDFFSGGFFESLLLLLAFSGLDLLDEPICCFLLPFLLNLILCQELPYTLFIWILVAS